MSTATFRFHDDLGLFLGRQLRGQAFAYRCARAATLKNAIEALGVPHTEVGEVTVNGEPATLQRVVREHDVIEIRPVGTEKIGTVPIFLADAHLGGIVIERPDWMALVDLAVMAIVGILLVWLLPRLGVSGGGVLAAAILAGYVAAAVYLFRSSGFWVNLVYPSLLIVLLFATATLVHYFFRVSEQRYLKRAFAHYVPPAVVEELAADAAKL